MKRILFCPGQKEYIRIHVQPPLKVPELWRHLDFFQFEAWLHADVPRVACGGCGKTTQLGVPWARPGSGFTAAFEALALALCRELPVRQAGALLRCSDKQLWRRIEFYVDQARASESFEGVQIVGIDETSVRRGQHYITVVHDLDAKRLLFAAEGRTIRQWWISPPTSRRTGVTRPRCGMYAWT
jgi:transposase